MPAMQQGNPGGLDNVERRCNFQLGEHILVVPQVQQHLCVGGNGGGCRVGTRPSSVDHNVPNLPVLQWEPRAPTVQNSRDGCLMKHSASAALVGVDLANIFKDDATATAWRKCLLCRNGHEMHAKVISEIWSRMKPWKKFPHCSRCDAEISRQDARFKCKTCKYALCMDCASEQLETSSAFLDCKNLSQHMLYRKPCVVECWRSWTSTLQTGDVLLCGPDVWGIHHVVLCCGEIRYNPGMAAYFGLVDDDLEVFSVDTIESSRPLKGVEMCWYPSHTYYGRHKTTGEVVVIADMPVGSDQIDVHEEQVPVKMLLHPFRLEHGSQLFDAKAFRKAVNFSAAESKRWSIGTGIRAVTTRQLSLEAADYPDEASRAELMEHLRRRWHTRPICSSVAIQVWQRYFELASQDAGPAAEDQAARAILRWMPVFADQTAPSTLLKVLSGHGWIPKARLLDSF
eukprot:TRINITY_DN48692_c0_g1_i1.p1 TRINITY_DN48692_c0_g1~~TRINITY_DN48692_c0_g1_i1.p1  ORF type:complete len:475 (-),score=61.32 TRINITY_DN48692_c0_g1_i1:117-1481(-)